MGAGCSSVELVTQRTSACMAPSLSAEAPARRVRDIEYAAELLGLRLDGRPTSIDDDDLIDAEAEEAGEEEEEE